MHAPSPGCGAKLNLWLVHIPLWSQGGGSQNPVLSARDPRLSCIPDFLGSLPAPHPCPPGIPACPGSLPAVPAAQPGWVVAVCSHSWLGTLIWGPSAVYPACSTASARVPRFPGAGYIYFFFPKILFSHANPSAVLGNAAASAAAEGARDERCHRATPIVKVT